ncbi:MAG: hypothetical protein ACE1Y7_12945, partial [Lysobacteraceae bacterium]
MQSRFGLGDAAAARLLEVAHQQEARHQAHQRRHQDEPSGGGFQAEELQVEAVDGQVEQNGGEAGDQADDNRQGKEN